MHLLLHRVLSEILDNNPSKRAKLTSSLSLLDVTTNQHSKSISNDETTRKLLKENRAKKLSELAKQINKGSAHKNLVDVLENQTEQIRLNNLEKRDEFEQKLVNQNKEACTYVICETVNIIEYFLLCNSNLPGISLCIRLLTKYF